MAQHQLAVIGFQRQFHESAIDEPCVFDDEESTHLGHNLT